LVVEKTQATGERKGKKDQNDSKDEKKAGT